MNCGSTIRRSQDSGERTAGPAFRCANQVHRHQHRAAGANHGCALSPGGAFSLFGIPADLFCDDHVTLDALWGAGADEIVEKLTLASNAEERLRALETALLDRVRSVNGIH